jgi:hypothetical protein
MQIIKLLLKVSCIIIFLCGFTLDYNVLSECEKKHPNDLITRIVCNNITEERNRELAALPCVNRSLDAMNARKPDFDSFLASNADNSYETIVKNLEMWGYPSDTVLNKKSTETKKLNTIVFSEKTKCNSSAYFLFNIQLNEDKKIEKMFVWLKKNDNESERLPYLTWYRAEHFKEIEAANIKKADEILEKIEQKKKIDAENKKIEQISNQNYQKFIKTSVIVLLILFFIFITFLYYKNSILINENGNKFKFNLKYKFPFGDKFQENYSSSKDAHLTDQFTSSNIDDSSKTSSVDEIEIQQKYSKSEPTKEYKEIEIPKSPTTETEKLIDRRFRDTNVFVNIYVPNKYQFHFLKECEWYKKKIGVYPGITDQENILKQILKNI